MSLFYIFFAVSIGALMLYRLARGDLASIPVLLVSLMMLVAWLAWHQIYYSPYAMLWSKYGAYYYGEQNLWYFTMICGLYLLAYVTAIVSTPQRNFRERMRRAIQGIRSQSLTIAAFFLVLFAIYHISILNTEILWSTQNYLEIASIRGLNSITPLNVLVQMLSKYVGVFSFICLGVSIVTRNKLAIAMSIIPATWFMLFDIAGHSRFAVVHAGVLASILLFDSRASSKFLGFIFLGLAFLNLINALAGRSSGSHGLSSLTDFFTYAANVFTADLGRLFGNVFEGAFVQGEVFMYENVQHDPLYKWLSLSPFPSSIDGFAHRARHMTFSFVSFVPMSATGEAYLFGLPYAAVYYLVVFTAYFMTVRAMRLGKIGLFFPMFMSVTLATYLQFSYPIRNVFRFFILAILIYTGSSIWRQLRKPLVIISQKNRHL